MGLAKQFLHKPEFLSLSKDQVHVAEVQHVFVTVEPMDKDRALVRILEVENPPSAIIFCNTKSRVEYLAQVLQRFGFDADMLTSDLTQNAREKVLQRIRAGTLKFLVATDVAARGIDIPQLSHVILYEPPEELEAYIHRAGRTGRVGASGTAISLVTDIEMFELRRIAKQYSIEMIQRSEPTDEDVRAIVSQRVTAYLEARLRKMDRVQRERIEWFLPMFEELHESEDGPAIVGMLLDEEYRKALQRPLEAPDLEGYGAQRQSQKPKNRGNRGGDRRRRRR
jgi:ATP-dependent RNA helicase DeaD